MSRVPGITLVLLVLIILLCYGTINAWNPSLLVGLGLGLLLLIGGLVLDGIRGGVDLLRLRRRTLGIDQQRAMERLVKSLTSEDRQEARRAARLLAEMTTPGTALNRGVIPPDSEPSWQRWNDWWLTNRPAPPTKNEGDTPDQGQPSVS